jgi:hypothetical protein
MKRAIHYSPLVLATVFGLGFVAYLVKGSALLGPASGTWAPVGALAAARADASAAMLKDGRVLVAGGEGASGVLASAELLASDGSFSPAAPMAFARKQHASVTLADGRVLVAGGLGVDGSALNSAELYDPTSDSWQAAGAMLEPRAGATATLLPDGRVLLAGGENSGTVSPTLEIFDPVAETFVYAGVMATPRKEHAAALLHDGRVLLAGGSEGTTALASTEIYDVESGLLALGPVLFSPRVKLSATTLLDGSVLIAGGSNGDADLASAEVFDPASGTLAPATSSLASPRQGHLAVRLPHNNSVLFVGGTSGGAVVSTAELYVPWADGFTATGAPSAARTNAAASPAVADGLLLVAGGYSSTPDSPLPTAEVYGFATVKTDKDDYAPGEIVTITGGGWEPQDSVMLTLHEINNPDPHPDRVWIVTADDNGNIFDNSFYPEAHDVGVRFYLTAVGARSQAQMTFTDAPKVGSVTVGAQSPSTLYAGDNGTFTITVFRGSGGGSLGAFTAALSITTALPTGATASFSPNPIAFSAGESSDTSTLTITTTATGAPGATPAGTTAFTVKAATSASDFANSPPTGSGSGSLVVTADANATALAVDNATGAFGGTTTLSATLTSGGSPLSGKTVSFSLNGAPVGNAVTNGSGLASLGGVSLAGIDAGTYASAVGATFAGGGNYQYASGTGQLTVDPAPTTTTITNAVALGTATVVGQAYTVKWTVTESAPGSPTGTVTVSGGSGCSAAVGVGQCDVTSTTAGSKTLTATYGGDSNFNGSTSAGVSHQVNQASTTTTITSDTPDPSVVGQAYTVKWSVTVDSPGSGTPTGTVTVSGGSGCSAPVEDGQCDVTSTTAGTKSLTATYEGDTNFSGNTSAGVSHEVVNPAALSITGFVAYKSGGAVGDVDLVPGDSVTIELTVANSAPAPRAAANDVAGSALTVTPTGTANAGTCSPAAPPSANIPAGPGAPLERKYTYTCGTVSGNGTLTFTASASGTDAISAAALNAGPAHSNSVNVVSDTTPPVTSKVVSTPKFGTNDFYVGPGSAFSLACADNEGGSGCETTYYTVIAAGDTCPLNTAEGSYTMYSAPFSLPSPDDKYRVCFFSKDKAGNREAVQYQKHYRDTTGPTLTKTIGSPNVLLGGVQYVKSTTPIKVDANDGSGSGVGTAACTITGAVTNAAYSAGDNFYLPAPPDGSKTFTVKCKDNLGNESSELTETDIVDDTAPVVDLTFPSPAFGQNGWFNAQDTVPVVGSADAADQTGITALSCSDTPGGLVQGDLMTPTATTGTRSQSVSGDGTHGISCTATDGLGNSGAAAGSTNTATVKIDQTLPSVTFGTPPTGSPYLLNQVVNAAFTCTDAMSGMAGAVPSPNGTVNGPGAANCSGATTVNTSSVGSKSYTATATDLAGNTATPSQAYEVTFNVCALYDQFKVWKSGSTIPVKLRLCDAGGANYSSSAIVVHATRLLFTGAIGDVDPQDSGNANPDDNFRLADGMYIFNLSTKGLIEQGTAWKLFFMATGDPVEHSVMFLIR